MNSQQITDLRRALGINQSQFWSRIGVTQSGGSRYENGRTIPKPVQTLLQLAYGDAAEAKGLFQRLRFAKMEVTANDR